MSQSRLIQVRLHPAEEGEADALAVFDERLEAGYTAREIVRDALLVLGGQPVYETSVMSAIRQMAEMIDSRFDELKTLAPGDRRRAVTDAGQSAFRKSIRQAVDVVEYEGE